MSNQKINPRPAVLLLFMLAVAAIRIPNAAHFGIWSNFTPIGAMGLFGGAYFSNKWKAAIFPLLTLFISDLIVHIIVFKGSYGIIYDGWYKIYAIFLLIVFIGRWMIRRVSFKNVLFAGIAASLTHWLLADLSVWLSGGTDLRTMQPLSRGLDGLMQCYLQGLPYMRNFLLGTLAYSGLMFGAFEWMKSRNTSLQTA
jgi:hypothetical protein